MAYLTETNFSTSHKPDLVMNYPINGWQWERGSYTVIIMDQRDRLCPKEVLFQSGGTYRVEWFVSVTEHKIMLKPRNHEC